MKLLCNDLSIFAHGHQVMWPLNLVHKTLEMQQLFCMQVNYSRPNVLANTEEKETVQLCMHRLTLCHTKLQLVLWNIQQAETVFFSVLDEILSQRIGMEWMLFLNINIIHRKRHIEQRGNCTINEYRTAHKNLVINVNKWHQVLAHGFH